MHEAVYTEMNAPSTCEDNSVSSILSCDGREGRIPADCTWDVQSLLNTFGAEDNALNHELDFDDLFGPDTFPNPSDGSTAFDAIFEEEIKRQWESLTDTFLPQPAALDPVAPVPDDQVNTQAPDVVDNPHGPNGSDIGLHGSDPTYDALPSIQVLPDMDCTPNTNLDPRSWTKNKLRCLPLRVNTLNDAKVHINDKIFCKGNSKLALVGLDDSSYELDVVVCRYDASTGFYVPIEPCSKCRDKKIIEVSSKHGQLVPCSNGCLDLLVKIQCLPSAHGSPFFLQITIKAPGSMAGLAEAILPIEKVIASRALKNNSAKPSKRKTSDVAGVAVKKQKL